MKKYIDFITFLLMPLAVTLDLAVIEDISRMIFYVIGALTALITLIYNLVIWFSKSKKDGKITEEEIEEGVNILGDGITALDETLKEGKKNEKND